MDAFSSSISSRFKCIRSCCRSYGPGLRWVFSIFCVRVPYTVPTYVSLFTPWSRLLIITATICSPLPGRNWKGSGYCSDFYRIITLDRYYLNLHRFIPPHFVSFVCQPSSTPLFHCRTQTHSDILKNMHTQTDRKILNCATVILSYSPIGTHTQRDIWIQM